LIGRPSSVCTIPIPTCPAPPADPITIPSSIPSQLISEAYDILKTIGGLSNEELAATFTEWNK